MRGISRIPSRWARPKIGALWPWVSAWRVSGWSADGFSLTKSRIELPSQAPQAMKRWESMQTRGGWLPVELGFWLTERGWAGVEAGMACEAGGGAASRRDDRDRGRAHGAWRGGGPGRPRAEARRGQAAHSGAPGRDGFGAAGRRGRAASRMRDVWTSAGQQGPLPSNVPLLVRRRAGSGPTVARLPLPRPGEGEELRRR